MRCMHIDNFLLAEAYTKIATIFFCIKKLVLLDFCGCKDSSKSTCVIDFLITIIIMMATSLVLHVVNNVLLKNNGSSVMIIMIDMLLQYNQPIERRVDQVRWFAWSSKYITLILDEKGIIFRLYPYIYIQIESLLESYVHTCAWLMELAATTIVNWSFGR